LIYLRDLKGLPVYYRNAPKSVAKVKDAVLDCPRGEITGLLIEAATIWKNPRFLPWENIIHLDKDKVVFDNRNALKNLGVRREKLLGENWLGMPILGMQNSDLGTIADIALDYPTGKLAGLNVSGGLWQDINKGWSYLSWQKVNQVEENCIKADELTD